MCRNALCLCAALTGGTTKRRGIDENRKLVPWLAQPTPQHPRSIEEINSGNAPHTIPMFHGRKIGSESSGKMRRAKRKSFILVGIESIMV